MDFALLLQMLLTCFLKIFFRINMKPLFPLFTCFPVFTSHKLIIHHLWLKAHSLARSFTAEGIKNKTGKSQNPCTGACALRYGQKQVVVGAFQRSKGTFRLPGDAQTPGLNSSRYGR